MIYFHKRRLCLSQKNRVKILVKLLYRFYIGVARLLQKQIFYSLYRLAKLQYHQHSHIRQKSSFLPCLNLVFKTLFIIELLPEPLGPANTLILFDILNQVALQCLIHYIKFVKSFDSTIRKLFYYPSVFSYNHISIFFHGFTCSFFKSSF
jgi:hypothetical protein